MCVHCYNVHKPSYNAHEACDLALAQRRKFDSDTDIKNGKPTMRISLGELISHAQKVRNP